MINKNINKKNVLNIIISITLSILVETYITLIENSYLINNYSNHDFIALFSYKEFIVFLITFLIIFYIIFDKDKKEKLFNFIYKYRLSLSFAIIIIAVVFQIHGSSINELNLFHVDHKTLLGISRPLRSDEYVVNTMLAFSQYMNDFSYFSDIVRGSLTDMFIIYGQPTLDVGAIFRPFLLGYLFLNPARGLSFFWIGRLVLLFLTSFEFGMLLTNKNKTLSVSYAFLITFSPVVQWWFAINGLVEQLIFGQFGVLLVHWYMLTNDYRKRFVIAFGIMICVGTFLLVFYPSWQIPYAYIFFVLVIWIFLKNLSNFKYTKKDLLICLFYLCIFSIIMTHILINSLDTINLILNSSYPGSQNFNGEGVFAALIYYVPSIFFPIKQSNLLINACNYSVFMDLFPIPLILSGFVLFYQKTKDKLLIGLLGMYIIFVIFYMVHFPDFIVDLTLRSTVKTTRLPSVISFIGVLILIRSLSSLKEFKNKKFNIGLSIMLAIIIVYLSTFEFGDYYLNWMPIIAVVIYSLLFCVSLFASSKRNQKIFLICIIGVSFLTGFLVNPIDEGADVIYGSDFTHHVEKIVDRDPDALWIAQDDSIHINNLLIPIGAKTVNSIHTYPDINKWQKLDPNKNYYETYNRYAHILVDIHDINETYFELKYGDVFVLHLNVYDLQKLNVSYIATSKNLEKLSNNNVEFEKIYKDHEYKIYHVKYENT